MQQVRGRPERDEHPPQDDPHRPDQVQRPPGGEVSLQATGVRLGLLLKPGRVHLVKAELVVEAGKKAKSLFKEYRLLSCWNSLVP